MNAFESNTTNDKGEYLVATKLNTAEMACLYAIAEELDISIPKLIWLMIRVELQETDPDIFPVTVRKEW